MRQLVPAVASTLAVAVLLAAAAPARAAEAVLTGKVAASAHTASAGGSGGAAGGAATGTPAQGTVITFTINSFTSEEQVAELKAAGDLKSFLSALSKMKAGTMTAKGQGSIPINAAFKDAAGAYVLLSSADPRTLTGSYYSGTGGAVGMSRLVPARGEGWLAATAQAVAFSGGVPVARAGGSQATALTEVAEQ